VFKMLIIRLNIKIMKKLNCKVVFLTFFLIFPVGIQ